VALKTLDLFSGIGGFARGLEATGFFSTTCFVEQDPYCQAVLKHHWPDVPVLGDIRNVQGPDLPTRPDVICGGFPCQPFSHAGKQRAQDDPRHLWPEMFRLIRECRPTWVVGENVIGLVQLGLDEVLSDLENEGYATRTFNIPACAVGAPHIRQRLWIVAHADSESEPDGAFDGNVRQRQLGFDFGGGEASSHGADPDDHGPRRTEKHQQDAQHGQTQLRDEQVRESGQVGADVADATDNGLRRREQLTQGGKGKGHVADADAGQRHGADEGVQPGGNVFDVGGSDVSDAGCGGGQGPWSEVGGRTPQAWWQFEPDVGRLANGVPNRVSQLRALGNTIIPQIAEEIGYAIAAAEGAE
jgi:DNA (cytosine-5)-methyltransferase 1